MSFGQTLVVAFCTAGTTALLTWLGQVLVANLQRQNEKVRYFREKIHERYAELVALATTELERARSLEAGLVIGTPDQDYSELAKIDHERHSLRLELLRVSLQIQLLEPDPALAAKAEALAKGQPFMAMALPPRWGYGNYNERFDKYKSEISTFEKLLKDLIETVLRAHSVAQERSDMLSMPSPIKKRQSA